MKKLSVSFIALLAIVIAVGSAFTTTKKSMAINDLFQIKAGVTPTQFASDNGTDDYDDINTYISITPATDEELENEDCFSDEAQFVCAFQITDISADNPNELDEADLANLKSSVGGGSLPLQGAVFVYYEQN